MTDIKTQLNNYCKNFKSVGFGRVTMDNTQERINRIQEVNKNIDRSKPSKFQAFLDWLAQPVNIGPVQSEEEARALSELSYGYWQAIRARDQPHLQERPQQLPTQEIHNHQHIHFHDSEGKESNNLDKNNSERLQKILDNIDRRLLK